MLQTKIDFRISGKRKLTCSIAKDKFAGILIGVALGDVLGAPHEFAAGNHILYTGKIYSKTFIPTRFQGKIELDVGQATDDTEMSVTLATKLVENSFVYKTDDLILAYMAWANSGACLGKNTRKLLHGVSTVKGYKTRYEKNVSLENESNGALMRSAILACLPEWEKAVVADCSITNPSLVCIAANQFYVGMVRDFATGLVVQDVKKYIQEKSDKLSETDVKVTVLDALAGTPRDLSYKTDKKGWCLHGIYAAVYCLVRFDSIEKALEWTIKENPGSDTDTNAAIVGGLFGAKYGKEGLLKNETTKNNWQTIISCDQTGGNKKRPEKYHPKMVEELLTRFEE